MSFERSLDEIIGKPEKPSYREREARVRNRAYTPRQSLTQKLSKGGAYLKMSVLNPEINKEDLERLFGQIAPVEFVLFVGRGVAHIGFKETQFNREAVEKFDGQLAMGVTVKVEEIKPLTLGSRSGPGVGLVRKDKKYSRARGERKRKPRPTVEDLDRELDSYMAE